MSETWTVERILELAPDAGAAKAGKDLASAKKWTGLGRGGGALWGECKGSGANPYQTRIDLSEPAFKCSCPSRKFPCKHGLGLFLVYAAKPADLAEGAQPAWVAEWMATRAKKAAGKSAKDSGTDSGAGAEAKPKKTPDPKAQAKRIAQRDGRVTEGLNELALWLGDLVREGLEQARTQPPSFWDNTSKRLIDAQAPGLARVARGIAPPDPKKVKKPAKKAKGKEPAPEPEDPWPSQALTGMARLHLAIQAWAHVDALPEGAREDLRTFIGFTQSQEALLQNEGVRDVWRTLGSSIDWRDEKIQMQRTWLRGEKSGRPAVLVSFAPEKQGGFEYNLPAGLAIDAELVFFPSAFPMRALIKDQKPPVPAGNEPVGYAGFEEAFAAQSEALAVNPWIDCFPMPLTSATLFRDGAAWRLIDGARRCVTLEMEEEAGWEALAVTGGHPAPFFGEWTGEMMRAVSVTAEGRTWPLFQRQKPKKK